MCPKIEKHKDINRARGIVPLQQNSAITLIALIITIIVLLILAGVTLNMVMGDSGIFSKANVANEETNKMQALEELRLKVLEVQTDKNGTATIKQVLEYLNLDPEYEYVLYGENATVKGDLSTISENTKQVYIGYKGYKFKIDNKLIVTFEGESEGKIEEDENKNPIRISARYILVEVEDLFENEDAAVINEISIFDKDYNKINYTIKQELEFENCRNGKSAYWNDSRWNNSYLYDGRINYGSNNEGNQNCTLFFWDRTNQNDIWARFIIDLGEETEVEQIRVCVGGTDEYSPAGSRTPKKVIFYDIDSFVDGTGDDSTYKNNIIQKNNEGLSKLCEKEFSNIYTEPKWFDVLTETPNVSVGSENDILKIRTMVNNGISFEGKTIQLTKDMDFSNICSETKGSWIPIGTETNKFEGTFNGNGHCINCLYINNSSSYQGLFGYIGKNGKISNLTLNGQIDAQTIAGAFAGENYGLIEGCINNMRLNTSGNFCGGIVGNNYGIIYKCINNGDITSNDQCASGIAGTNGCYSGSGFIVESINNGNITSSSWTSGGITAVNGNFGSNARGYICNSYNTGTILGGNDRRGGIVGQVKCMGGRSYVYNCYNRGDIQGCPEIIGYDWGGGDSSICLNSYGSLEATIENLNTESEIEQELIDIGLYRTDAWTIKNGKIALSWE